MQSNGPLPECEPAAENQAVPATRRQRVLGLDILRFVAVTLVVFRHVELLTCPAGTTGPGLWVEKIANALNSGGWVGGR